MSQLPTIGSILPCDGEAIARALDAVCERFPNEPIKVIELGVERGLTTQGIIQYMVAKERELSWRGVDCIRQGYDPRTFPGTEPRTKEVIAQGLIEGFTHEHADKFDNCHFLYVDACHCRPCVLQDARLYLPKVLIGGMVAFHDTAPAAQSIDQPLARGWEEHRPQRVRDALEELDLENNGYRLVDDVFVPGQIMGMMTYEKVSA